MIKIYGSPKSSAGRVYWMMEELGLSYERAPLNMSQKEHKAPDFLKLNPNGKVPCLVDGTFVLWESMAITEYLVQKYGANSSLAAKTPEETGLISQWSFWSILELQKHAVEWLIQEHFMPAERKDAGVVEKAQKALLPLFAILDQALENKTYLIGNRFTIADLHVASVVNVAAGLGFNVASFPHVQTWIKACHDRPAWHRYNSLPL
ncbi:MAG: hypothetical protein RJB66_1940 [Pseudomonadota bacterium]|jgi:glutathione S-transferase